MSISLAQTEIDIVQSVSKALTDLVESIIDFIPGFVGGLTIFIVGCLIATIVRRLLTTILTKIGLDTMSDRVGIKEMLASIGLKIPLPVILGKVVFWVLVLMFLMTAAQVIPGLESIAQVLKDIVTYFPKAASAVLYGLAGLLVARLVHGALLNSAESVGLEYARPLANVVYGFLVVVVATLAIGQMEIETELLSKTIQISLGSVALALALAIGLGMTGIAKNIAAGVYARDLFKPGHELEMEGKSYKVIGVGATSTRLEHADGSFLVAPNAKMIDSVVIGRPGNHAKPDSEERPRKK